MRKICLFIFLSLVVASVASAQPFGPRFTVPTGNSYVAILSPGSAFDFTTGFTFEAWVSVHDNGPCTSIAGRNYTTAWWVGLCGTTFRSYIRGTSSLFDGGKIPVDTWTHVAVTFDGTTRRHFIDGEEVASHAESGPMTPSATEVRIFSDTAWAFTPPGGSIDEVRFWNVARSQAEIRSTITKTISTATPGLVAVYHLDGNANDSVGGHNGTIGGATGGFANPTASTCVPSTTKLCLENRYQVSATWIAHDATTGVGTVVPGASTNSGLFWFFGSDNWELLVKELNGCGLNAHRWVFSAATTDVHYQLSVIDTNTGESKRYFNYINNSAPAVTDTSALGCP